MLLVPVEPFVSTHSAGDDVDMPCWRGDGWHGSEQAVQSFDGCHDSALQAPVLQAVDHGNSGTPTQCREGTSTPASDEHATERVMVPEPQDLEQVPQGLANHLYACAWGAGAGEGEDDRRADSDIDADRDDTALDTAD